MQLVKRIQLILCMLFLLGSVLIYPAAALEIGGHMELDYYIDDISENNFSAGWRGSAELEFFLPAAAGFTPRFILKAGVLPGNSFIGVKYLYIRQQREMGRLTLGRQPVSWSYGSVINPFNFGPDIEGLTPESEAESVDGIRYSHALGQGQRLEVVLGFKQTPAAAGDLDLGVRLHIPEPGYDLSINAVSQVFGNSRLTRAGVTCKMDFMDIGFYGAGGVFHLEHDSTDFTDPVLQLGGDYSFLVGEYEQNRILTQLEYIRFLNKNLNFGHLLQTHDDVGAFNGSPEQGTVLTSAYDLIIAHFDYQLDRFAHTGLSLLAESNNQHVFLLPYYSEELGGGLEYRLQGNIFRDSEREFTTGAGVQLRYYF